MGALAKGRSACSQEPVFSVPAYQDPVPLNLFHLCKRETSASVLLVSGHPLFLAKCQLPPGGGGPSQFPEEGPLGGLGQLPRRRLLEGRATLWITLISASIRATRTVTGGMSRMKTAWAAPDG